MEAKTAEPAKPVEQAKPSSTTSTNINAIPKGTGSLADLQAALAKGEFKVEVAEGDKALDVNQGAVEEAWQKFLAKEELPKNFVSNASALKPQLKANNTIELTVYSNVARGFIMEQGSEIKAYMREYFKRTDIHLNIEVDITEEVKEKDERYLTPKELFDQMAKENPALIDFQKKFDLDIDYDN